MRISSHEPRHWPANRSRSGSAARAAIPRPSRCGVSEWLKYGTRSAASPLARVVEGLVLAVDPAATPELMANSVAMLQLDLADPDFHAETLRGAQAVRARIARDLSGALAAGELRPGTDVATLAQLVETTYHGAMIGWAIHRENTLADWMREQVEAVLAPHRTGR